MELTIPKSLEASCRKKPERMAWLIALPDAVCDLKSRWSLELGIPFDGPEVSCGWVAPVTRADGKRAVLKLGMPHMEGEHELEGLRFWEGDPTVRLIDGDVGLNAMLLEHCDPGTVLRTIPEPEQDVVIAGLLRRLWRTPSPPHPFRMLSTMLEHWTSATLADIEKWPDAGLVRGGLDAFEELQSTTTVDVLLATDLHAGNVLRAQRESWLAIDPKPFIGDPAYDATQHLLNCMERLCAEPGETIRRFASILGVDSERVRLWIFARVAAEPRDNWTGGLELELARALAP